MNVNALSSVDVIVLLFLELLHRTGSLGWTNLDGSIREQQSKTLLSDRCLQDINSRYLFLRGLGVDPVVIISSEPKMFDVPLL